MMTSCASCAGTSDLHRSTCRHMVLCLACGKTMAEKATPCPECRLPISHLTREFFVKAHPLNKPHFVGRFVQGMPSFSKKKGGDQKWTMQREGLQGRQLTDAQREKYKGKAWLLNEDQGQQSFQGTLEGGQQASYYLLMMQGKDFLAMPAGAWYNFHKVTNYKQLTLEEAEEQMKNRRKTADGYQRWLMKAANTGAAAFGEVEKDGGGGGGRGGFKRRADDDEDPAFSDKGEEDVDDDEERKNRLGMNKKGGDEDGEEPARGDDRELEDEEPERGDDWEHEETFTDDDEAVGNDPEERDDNAPEIPAPPEIKQEEEDEGGEQEDGQQEKGGLSESGLELKKLLGKSAGLDESDDESSDEDNDLDNEDNTSPVLAPKRKEPPKEESVDSTPSKLANAALGRSTPATATASKGKRKAGMDDSKQSPGANTKKVKTEAQEELKQAKKEPVGSVPAASAMKGSSSKGSSPAKAGGTSTQGKSQAVTEEDVKAVLKQAGPIKSHDLVNKFKSRLATSEDKAAFAAVLKNISRIHKTDAGNFIVLRGEK